MHRDRHEFLRRLDERLSRVSSWLAARRRVGEGAHERLHAGIELLRRDISLARQASAQAAHDAVASARATLDDMDRDYGIPRPRSALRRDELEALRRHLQLTAKLLPHLSDLDDPGWGPAHEEYERSWDELQRAVDSEGGAAPP